MSLTIKQKIEYFEQRAEQERVAAAAADCIEARRAHEFLAQQHVRAANEERNRSARYLAVAS